MTAEELMNSEKYEPDSGISFEEYNGDAIGFVPSMMIEFAAYHVEKALMAASEKAIAKENHSDYGTGSIWVDEKSILESYPLSNIK